MILKTLWHSHFGHALLKATKRSIILELICFITPILVFFLSCFFFPHARNELWLEERLGHLHSFESLWVFMNHNLRNKVYRSVFASMILHCLHQNHLESLFKMLISGLHLNPIESESPGMEFRNLDLERSFHVVYMPT